jgi:hypothetical protein
MPFIDAHVHVWTPDTAHYPLAAGFKRENMSPRSFTPEELFKHTRPANVDRINLIQMSFYGFDNRYVIGRRKAVIHSWTIHQSRTSQVQIACGRSLRCGCAAKMMLGPNCAPFANGRRSPFPLS